MIWQQSSSLQSRRRSECSTHAIFIEQCGGTDVYNATFGLHHETATRRRARLARRVRQQVCETSGDKINATFSTSKFAILLTKFTDHTIFDKCDVWPYTIS